ncbi:hypothetical protein GCM10008941_32850 [Rhizomicrobium palustre]
MICRSAETSGEMRPSKGVRGPMAIPGGGGEVGTGTVCALAAAKLKLAAMATAKIVIFIWASPP